MSELMPLKMEGWAAGNGGAQSGSLLSRINVLMQSLGAGEPRPNEAL